MSEDTQLQHTEERFAEVGHQLAASQASLTGTIELDNQFVQLRAELATPAQEIPISPTLAARLFTPSRWPSDIDGSTNSISADLDSLRALEPTPSSWADRCCPDLRIDPWAVTPLSLYLGSGLPTSPALPTERHVSDSHQDSVEMLRRRSPPDTTVTVNGVEVVRSYSRGPASPAAPTVGSRDSDSEELANSIIANIFNVFSSSKGRP